MLIVAAALSLAVAQQVQPFAVPAADGYVLTGQADAPEGPSRGVVILVAGTGAFDRDVTLGRSGTPRDRLFADLAGRFTARGLTAVRFDRRRGRGSAAGESGAVRDPSRTRPHPWDGNASGPRRRSDRRPDRG